MHLLHHQTFHVQFIEKKSFSLKRNYKQKSLRSLYEYHHLNGVYL